jgi:hypothetical protein
MTLRRGVRHYRSDYSIPTMSSDVNLKVQACPYRWYGHPRQFRWSGIALTRTPGRPCRDVTLTTSVAPNTMVVVQPSDVTWQVDAFNRDAFRVPTPWHTGRRFTSPVSRLGSSLATAETPFPQTHHHTKTHPQSGHPPDTHACPRSPQHSKEPYFPGDRPIFVGK